MYNHLLSGYGPFLCVLFLDAIDALLLVIDLFFYLGLVQTIYDRVLSLRHVY